MVPRKKKGENIKREMKKLERNVAWNISARTSSPPRLFHAQHHHAPPSHREHALMRELRAFGHKKRRPNQGGEDPRPPVPLSRACRCKEACGKGGSSRSPYSPILCMPPRSSIYYVVSQCCTCPQIRTIVIRSMTRLPVPGIIRYGI